MKRIIRWEDPPPSKGSERTEAWVPVADALRANPGQWALIEEATTVSPANHISHAKIAAFRPPGAFEAVARSAGPSPDGKRRHNIYARFVGEPGD